MKGKRSVPARLHWGPEKTHSCFGTSTLKKESEDGPQGGLWKSIETLGAHGALRRLQSERLGKAQGVDWGKKRKS